MNARTRRIEPLMQRAQAEQQRCERSLAESGRTLAFQEQRLQELKRYAEEYALSTPDGMATALLSNRRAFCSRLDDAVGQQQRLLEQARRKMAVERARLQLASRNNQVLEKLAENYRSEEHKVESRRVQRELDDHANRLACQRVLPGSGT